MLKMKFVGQDIEKLEPEQYKDTHGKTPSNALTIEVLRIIYKASSNVEA